MDHRVLTDDLLPMPQIETRAEIYRVGLFIFKGVFLYMVLVLKRRYVVRFDIKEGVSSAR
jgi:hypothetical protein